MQRARVFPDFICYPSNYELSKFILFGRVTFVWKDLIVWEGVVFGVEF